QGGRVDTFDDAKVTDLCGYVDGKEIPLGIDAGPGQAGREAISGEMTKICHKLMEILFVAKKDEKGKADDGGSGTGINLSMLKQFLMDNLPEMVSLSYMAAGPSDL